MTSDSRLPLYREAAQAMGRGRFDLPIPVGEPDEVGALGEALTELARGLERRFAVQTLLAGLTQSINAGLLLEEVLEQLYASFRTALPYDRIGFALLEDEGRILRARWAKSEYPTPSLKVGYSAPMAGSSLEEVLRTRRPRIINDLEAYHRDHPASHSAPLMLAEGIRSSLTCPLVAMGRPVGFLFFSSRRPGTYADAHADTFLQVAGTVSTIVEKSRLYGELVELNRLKNSFLGMVAHDLRGPIGNIINYVELLRGGFRVDEEGRQEAIAGIGKIAASCLRLLETTLDVAAIESGHMRFDPRPVELKRFLRHAARMGTLMARAKSSTVSLQLAPSLPKTFTLDPDRMEQVLGNLVSNALKFAEPGRTVTISAWGEEGGVAFAVSDQGPGIPEERIPQLFKEYGRLGAPTTGGEPSVGLGLAIVRKVVEAHRGRIRVASAPGQGAAFTVHLPPPAPSR